MTPETLIDLSHLIEAGLITYKGLPAPLICDFLSREDSRAYYSEGTEFHIGQIEMVANSGTYIDAPFHRFAEGIDVAGLPLASIANLEGVIISTQEAGRAIDTAVLPDIDLAGKAVLFHTGWSRYWRSDAYFEGHPFLTEALAVSLRSVGVALVGIDSYNIDDTEDGRRPVHTTLLGANIPIVEHMTNLAALPPTGFRFFALPAKVKGLGSFPIRALAMVA